MKTPRGSHDPASNVLLPSTTSGISAASWRRMQQIAAKVFSSPSAGSMSGCRSTVTSDAPSGANGSRSARYSSRVGMPSRSSSASGAASRSQTGMPCDPCRRIGRIIFKRETDRILRRGFNLIGASRQDSHANGFILLDHIQIRDRHQVQIRRGHARRNRQARNIPGIIRAGCRGATVIQRERDRQRASVREGETRHAGHAATFFRQRADSADSHGRDRIMGQRKRDLPGGLTVSIDSDEIGHRLRRPGRLASSSIRRHHRRPRRCGSGKPRWHRCRVRATYRNCCHGYGFPPPRQQARSTATTRSVRRSVRSRDAMAHRFRASRRHPTRWPR